MTKVDRRLADVYGHLLSEALSGPYSDVFAAELGQGTLPLWRALFERHRQRLKRSGDKVPIDDIDWAAARVLSPLAARVYDDATLYSTTGHRLRDLAELERTAVSMWREYRTPPHAIAYRIGECVVEFPTDYVAQGVMLAVIPDAGSWDRVVPKCARGRRDEFVVPLRSRYQGSKAATRLWEERRVKTLEELRRWVESKDARIYRAANAEANDVQP